MTVPNQSHAAKKGDAPKVLNFEASPEQVERGSVVTLRWRLAGGAADKVLLDGQPVQGTSCTRTPSQDPTIYTLAAMNAAGSDSQEVAVGVHETGDVVSGEFIAVLSPQAAASSRLQIADHLGNPRAGVAYRLELSTGEVLQGSTGRDGWTESIAGKKAASARLFVEDQVYAISFVDRVGSAAADVQSMLNTAGFDAGPLDGDVGPQTRAALAAYQRSTGLPITSKPDDATIAHLRERIGLANA
jgi:hypothetical protein